jgi:class 3 adenylate cyclase
LTRRPGLLPPDLAEVLDRHLGLSQSPPARPIPPELETMVERQLAALGLESEAPAARATAADAIVRTIAAGIDPDAIYAMAQAYGRGVGRITAAEAEVVRRIVRDVAPDDRARMLDELFQRTLPMTTDLFTVVQAAKLWDQLHDALDKRYLEEPDVSERTIGLVDIVASTRHLATATAERTIELVDALYEAGQAAARPGYVHVVKYVGDGVFLLGRDTAAVAEAASEAIGRLRERTRLEVRAGIARGQVVRRAGDYFGLAVNKAHRLASEAEPGTVLVEAGALAEPPQPFERVRIQLRGVPGPTEAVVIQA